MIVLYEFIILVGESQAEAKAGVQVQSGGDDVGGVSPDDPSAFTPSPTRTSSMDLKTQREIHNHPLTRLESWTIPHPLHGLPGLGPQSKRYPKSALERGDILVPGTMVAIIMDDAQPLNVGMIEDIYTSHKFGGTWARIRWWIYTGQTAYPTGKFRRGIDETALDNIPLTSFQGLDAAALVHWSIPGGKYPVLTKRGILTGTVRRLASSDIRFQDNPAISEMFK